MMGVFCVGGNDGVILAHAVQIHLKLPAFELIPG